MPLRLYQRDVKILQKQILRAEAQSRRDLFSLRLGAKQNLISLSIQSVLGINAPKIFGMPLYLYSISVIIPLIRFGAE
jgi:hypothetical protein